MHASVRSADAGDNSLIIFVESVNGKVCSQLICENEVIGIVLHLTGLEPVFCLTALFITEIVKANHGRLNGARLAVLGGIRDVVDTACFLLTLELLVDGNSASLKVHL